MSEALGVAVLEVRADISKLIQGIDKAKNYSEATLRSAGHGMMDVGSQLTSTVTRPVIGLINNVTDLAIEWESSFADVKKATQGTDQEIAALGEQILELSTTTPVKPESIAQIVALGGQLGIARGEVLDFADTISRLGVSTNLTVEDAAMKFAKFTTITAQVAPAGQSAAEQIARMGNVLVHLGNNSKTTEKDIMSFGMRIAAAGSTVGMSQQEILGWAAAMSSVGLTAERGGTAISQALQKMAKATAQGGEELENFAKVAGMTSDQFANLFRDDPSRAVLAFADGLKKVNDSGGDVYGTLASVGISGSAMVDTLTRISGNTAEVSRILGVANEGYRENNALLEESNKRFGTSESQIQMAKNSLQVLGITIGNAVLPALVSMLQQLTPVIVSVAQFAAQNPEIANLALAFLAVAAAIGPVLTAVGAAMTFFGSLGTMVSFLTPVVTTAGAAIGAAIGAISLPIALVGAAIAALTVVWYNNWFGIQDVTVAAWNFIKNTFNANATAITTIITGLWESIKATWNTGKLNIEALTTALSSVLTATWSNLLSTLSTLTGGFSDSLISAWSSLKATLTGQTQNLSASQISTFSSMFASLNAGSLAFSLTQASQWSGLTSTLQSTITQFADSAKALFSAFFDAVKTWADTLKTSVVASANGLKDGFINAISSLVAGATSAISGMASEIMSILGGLIGQAMSAGAGMAQAFGDGIRSALSSALDAARSMAQALRDLLPGSDAKRGPLSDLTASGAALPATFAKGIDMTAPTLTRSVSGAISNAVTNNVTINNPVGKTSRASLISTLQNMEFAT